MKVCIVILGWFSSPCNFATNDLLPLPFLGVSQELLRSYFLPRQQCVNGRKMDTAHTAIPVNLYTTRKSTFLPCTCDLSTPCCCFTVLKVDLPLGGRIVLAASCSSVFCTYEFLVQSQVFMLEKTIRDGEIIASCPEPTSPSVRRLLQNWQFFLLFATSLQEWDSLHLQRLLQLTMTCSCVDLAAFKLLLCLRGLLGQLIPPGLSSWSSGLSLATAPLSRLPPRQSLSQPPRMLLLGWHISLNSHNASCLPGWSTEKGVSKVP